MYDDPWIAFLEALAKVPDLRLQYVLAIFVGIVVEYHSLLGAQIVARHMVILDAVSVHL